VSDDQELAAVERLLRSTPAPLDVPPGYAERASDAALESANAPSVISAGRRGLPWSRRLLPASLVLVGAAAASLLIGVGGRTNSVQVDRRVALVAVGASHGSGTLEFDTASGPMRSVVLTVHGLPPAPSGHYYEMRFWEGSSGLGTMSFTTASDGTATIRGEVPADIKWRWCTVSLEPLGAGASRTVLTSKSA
jgi:hypothetical protein